MYVYIYTDNSLLASILIWSSTLFLYKYIIKAEQNSITALTIIYPIFPARYPMVREAVIT